MKKKLIVLVVGVALMLVFAAGCTGGSDVTKAQYNALVTRTAELETHVDSLGGSYADAGVVAGIKADVTNLKNQVAALPASTDYSGQIESLETDYDGIVDRITSLESADPVDPPALPIDMLSAYAELGASAIEITTHAPQDMVVSFEITFHINDPVDVGVPGDSINDVIKLLYTDSPVQVKAGTQILTPKFQLSYDADDDQWQLFQVVFTSQGTTVTEGESIKSMVVLAADVGDFVTVRVMPVAASGSTSIW